MKTLKLPSAIMIAVFIQLCTPFVTAQDWHPPVELVNTGVDNEFPQIAVVDNMLHVVWTDWRSPSIFGEIYYKRSTDFGLTWEPGIKLSDMPSNSGATYAKVVVRDNIVHVVWAQYNTIHDQVYYCRSTDDGASFSTAIELSAPPSDILYPDIAVFEDHVHIVYLDDKSLPLRSIYYFRSDDNGNTWSMEKLLTVDGQIAYKPKIAVSGQHVFVTWNEQTNNPSEIFFMRSFDNGENWDPPVLISSTHNIQSQHDLTAPNDHDIHLAWEDRRDGHDEIYYTVSHDAGENWEPEKRLSFSSLWTSNPSLAAVGDKVYLTYDIMFGAEYIFITESSDGGVEWTEQYRLDETSGLALYPCVAAYSDDLYVVWVQGSSVYLMDVYFRRRIDHSAVDEGGIKGKGLPYLYQNHPNPFTDKTSVGFYLPEQSKVFLNIYNARGQLISNLVACEKLAGKHHIMWDATGLETGLYFYVLKTDKMAPGNTILKKMIIQ